MIVGAERDEAGMRRLPLEQAQSGRGKQIHIDESERIADVRQELRLLGLTVDELVGDGVAQVVSTDGISHLVFPPNLLRMGDSGEPRPERATSCRFTGAVDDIFYSLVVRLLGLENHYQKPKIWRDRASFAPTSGGRCEIGLEPDETGQEAELSVYFHEGTNEAERSNFLELVRKHIKRRARSVVGEFAPVKVGSPTLDNVEVFVSYRTDGTDVRTIENVRSVVGRLERRGIRCVGVSDTSLGIARSERISQIEGRRVALFLLAGSLSRAQEIDYRRLRSSGCRMIPVILPNAKKTFAVPTALKEWESLDLRGRFLDDDIERLVKGILDAWQRGPAQVRPPHGHVFISYFHDDYDDVADLQRELEAAGHAVWWDQGKGSLRPGTLWEREIGDAIKRSYAFVMCVSHSFAVGRQSFVYPELRQAIKIQRSLSAARVFIIPVRLAECEIPDEPIDELRTLRSLQYFDYFDASRRVLELVSVLDTARAHAAEGARSASSGPPSNI